MVNGSDKKDIFLNALEGKNIPVLTLDNKWYKLLDKLGRSEVKDCENNLNSLLKRQGKLNTESKEIRMLKKKLMNEIVPMVDEAASSSDKDIDKEIEEHKRLIEECNEKLQDYSDELLDLPRDISRINRQLMLSTMACCYDTIQNNTERIRDIEEWVTQIRIELKKKLIYKQEMEQKNHEIYSYMHDIFGAEVLDLFDIKYNPEEKHPTLPKDED